MCIRDSYMIVPLFVGREQSVQAVEAAATHGRHIFLCAQKDGQVDNPKEMCIRDRVKDAISYVQNHTN